jgi:hypothetical protein
VSDADHDPDAPRSRDAEPSREAKAMLLAGAVAVGIGRVVGTADDPDRE